MLFDSIDLRALFGVYAGIICFYMLFLASFAIRDYTHLYESNPRKLIVLTMYNLGATHFV